MRSSLQAPNPRLQRTPPASPPSPLSRKPLGRVIPIVALVLVVAGCGSESDWTGVSISASEEWVDATVTIDSHQVGRLQHPMLHDTTGEKLLKRGYGDSPMFHLVALNVSFDASKARRRVHKVRIEKEGRNPVEGEFTFPDPRGSSVQHLMINGQSLEISPGPDAKASGS
jgi:hypothetical protein